MIPRGYIEEWRSSAPWPESFQVEQDLILSRIITDLFNNDFIRSNYAFRGGTALHKLYLSPQVRYSEDIDLVQVKSGPIKDTLKLINKILNFIDGKRSVKQSGSNNTVVYQFETEIAPVVSKKLKIEINCREHFNVFGLRGIKFNCDSSWYSSETEVTTYSIEELLSTKLRALYQRKKGRDLFDLYYALSNTDTDHEKIIYSFKKYMNESSTHIPSSKEYILNVEKKLTSNEFTGDIYSLLRPGVKYDAKIAYDTVREKILEKI